MTLCYCEPRCFCRGEVPRLRSGLFEGMVSEVEPQSFKKVATSSQNTLLLAMTRRMEARAHSINR